MLYYVRPSAANLITVNLTAIKLIAVTKSDFPTLPQSQIPRVAAISLLWADCWRRYW